ncbi:MAG TPA: hypothetical protein VJN92_02780 [Candidatus Acidoferrum sp.]|nr:hypothetical protein [Candidatus Acidoferrum sp.]
MDKSVPILVVSSEFRNCNALRDILSREGRKTIYASTVGECQKVLANQNFDIVFCEPRLTDGTYRDILTLTRSRGQSVRLVVTSRLADWDEYLEALDNGAFDLISSPSPTADIVRVLNQALREDQITGGPANGKGIEAMAGGPVSSRVISTGITIQVGTNTPH